MLRSFARLPASTAAQVVRSRAHSSITGALAAQTVLCSESGGVWRSWNQPPRAERVAEGEGVESGAGRGGEGDDLGFGAP